MFTRCRCCGNRLNLLRWAQCVFRTKTLIRHTQSCNGKPLEQLIRWNCAACARRVSEG